MTLQLVSAKIAEYFLKVTSTDTHLIHLQSNHQSVITLIELNICISRAWMTEPVTQGATDNVSLS